MADGTVFHTVCIFVDRELWCLLWEFLICCWLIFIWLTLAIIHQAKSGNVIPVGKEQKINLGTYHHKIMLL
jgi:ABC-type enterochelin transport system permease subunit